jgi:pSer/pThr/pTyr-binding forkhead associated (FHA) protein
VERYPASIGRDARCDIRLDDPSVSLKHASIERRDLSLILTDHGSRNGTLVRGARLPPGASHLLNDKDLVQIGQIWLQVKVDAGPSVGGSAMTTIEIARELANRATDLVGPAGAPWIVVTRGAASGRVLFLDETSRTYVLGRGREADLDVDDPQASRRHVEVVRRGDHVMARGLASRNGAKLRSLPLDDSGETRWNPGEELVFGDHTLVLRYPSAEVWSKLRRTHEELPATADALVLPPREPDAVEGEPARAVDPQNGAASGARGSIQEAERVRARVPARFDGSVLLIGLVAVLGAGLITIGICVLFVW